MLPAPLRLKVAATRLVGSALCLVLHGCSGESTPPSVRSGPAPAQASSGTPLLRPLASRIDARFTGRLMLPPPRSSPDDETPAETAAIAALERLWQQASVADPADVGAYLDCHRRLLWLGWWTRASDAVKALWEVVPDYPPALALLAATHLEKGLRQNARTLARRALTADPALVLAMVCDAEASAAEGASGNARSILERALQVEPDAPEVLHLLGRVLADRNEFAAAIPYLRRARDHLPEPAGGKGAYIGSIEAFAQLLAGRRPHRLPAGFRGAAVPAERQPLWRVAVRATGRGGGRDGFMVVDSGASMTVVGPELTALLQVGTFRSAPNHGAAGSFSTTPALLEGLALGEVTIADVPVMLDHGRKEALGPGIIGSLGVSLLREFLVTLDLRHGKEQLRLDPPGTQVPPGRVDVPFELINNQPMVRARLGAARERQFLFDTGADALFLGAAVAREDLGKGPGDPGTKLRPTVAVGGQEIQGVEVPVTVPLVLGGQALPVHRAVTDPHLEHRNAAARTEAAGTIGVFLRGRYTLDFARQRLRIEP